MADSEGESPKSVMSVRSAEQSASCTRTSNHVLPLLPPETIVPPPVKTHNAPLESLHDAAVHAHRLDMPGEKKRKLDIPGRNGTTIDGEMPLDLINAKCQFTEMLAQYPHVEGRLGNHCKVSRELKCVKGIMRRSIG